MDTTAVKNIWQQRFALCIHYDIFVPRPLAIGLEVLLSTPPHVIPVKEAVSVCLCEGVKRLKQSHKALKTRRFPRSLRSLAMTERDCDTASKTGIQRAEFRT
jgi:hypothetical protein